MLLDLRNDGGFGWVVGFRWRLILELLQIQSQSGRVSFRYGRVAEFTLKVGGIGGSVCDLEMNFTIVCGRSAAA